MGTQNMGLFGSPCTSLHMPTVEHRVVCFPLKYEHFIQVSSKQKHTHIMWFDVRCDQESISKQQRSFAYSHGGGLMHFSKVQNEE